MSRMGRVNITEFENMRKRLEKINQAKIDELIDGCAKEITARLLRKVIKRTPVGDYGKKSGKKGGTLRRGWTAGRKQSAIKYADSINVHHFGDTYVVEIINPVEYAQYVEYGHRTSNHKGWVEGKYMLKISEEEIRSIAPNVIQARIKKELAELLDD